MFQDVIKDLRVQKGLTTDEVALEIGVSGGAYRNYERGERTPDFVKLGKLADFYGVSVDYLLGRDTEPKPLEQLAKISAMDVTEETLVEEYLKLPTESRQIIINFLKNAIKEAEERAKETQQATDTPIKQKSTYTCGELDDIRKAEQVAEQDAG